MMGTRFSSSDDVFGYLMNFVNVERGQATVFKLDRMRYLASLLGDPHRGRLTIHVAGSKGKGSVSTMCAEILDAAGYLTGIYTSPHLLRWKERIAFAGGEMPEDTLLQAVDELLPFIEGKGPADFPGDEMPTFFELTTLVAFCAFRRSGCTAQVIEVGLGGRLDSTNIVEPDVSVITPIELEHTQFLGDTIAKIAFEKAGIIKPGKPVCIAAQKPEAREVFEARAKELECPLYGLGKDIGVEGEDISLEGSGCRISPTRDSPSWLARILPSEGLAVRSPMIGAIQTQNMALAALASACALPDLSQDAVRTGLGRARLPARFELVSFEPPVVLDGAHTPESIRLTIASMASLFKGEKILLFACAYDKKHGEMARLLAPHFDAIIVTKPGTFKVSDPEAVYASFKTLKPGSRYIPETGAAVLEAISEAGRRKAALLVTGSFYLCAEAEIVVKTLKAKK